MARTRLAAMAVAAVLTSACGASDDDATDETAATTAAAAQTTAEGTDTSGGGTETSAGEQTTTSAEAATPMFGSVESPCGPGDATIAEGQNGGETLKLGTATDKGFTVSPGLTIEMLDAAKAFAGWCNEQGGIQGLPIEVVDLDGKFFEVAATMERACAEVFAMVGGGWVLDDQEFPRFHECKMIDFPGYTVTTAKAMSNGKVQPIPNPSNVKPATWLAWARDSYPEEVKTTATMYGDFLSTQLVEQQLVETMGKVGGFQVVDRIPYNPGGEANWAPFVQRLKDKGVQTLSYVGSPNQFVLVLRAMDEVGYRPKLILQEANFYDELITEQGGTSAEGVIARTAYAPFEEADQFPAMATYLEIMETHNPEGKIAGLGLQAMSAYLLFATAANACLDANGGVLERECVLAEGMKITSWTGGGLHTETDPGAGLPPKCTVMMQVQDGAWTRLYPELGGPDDNGDGWHCLEDGGTVELEGDYGDVNAGVDPTRPS